jgi:hypothetical protein
LDEDLPVNSAAAAVEISFLAKSGEDVLPREVRPCSVVKDAAAWLRSGKLPLGLQAQVEAQPLPSSPPSGMSVMVRRNVAGGVGLLPLSKCPLRPGGQVEAQHGGGGTLMPFLLQGLAVLGTCLVLLVAAPDAKRSRRRCGRGLLCRLLFVGMLIVQMLEVEGAAKKASRTAGKKGARPGRAASRSASHMKRPASASKERSRSDEATTRRITLAGSPPTTKSSKGPGTGGRRGSRASASGQEPGDDEYEAASRWFYLPGDADEISEATFDSFITLLEIAAWVSSRRPS